MSALVPSEEIEGVVGVRRLNSQHLGRAVSDEQTVYILHSRQCKQSGIDLRECVFSVALDRGIDLDDWSGKQDEPVQVLVRDGRGTPPEGGDPDMSGTSTAATPPPPILSHPVMTAAQGLFLVLNAASLRRLPMPFAARAYDYSPVVEFQFAHRAEVVTWAAGLDVAEVIEEPTADGINDQTLFETVWLDVPIRCAASIPREPR